MEWSPRTADAVALVVVGLGLALAVVVLDPAGRVLVGAAAVLCLALAGRDLLLRPRLSARPDGVEVRTLSGRQRLAWSRLRVRVHTSRRWGLTSRTLELDTDGGPDDDGVLFILGRRDLGADPADVASVLRELDPRP